MTRGRKIVLVVVATCLVVFSLALWALGTDSGTRWVLARAEAYLPPELTVGESRGSILRGLDISSIRWRDESVDAVLQDVSVNVELLPLFSRQVAIRALDVGSVDVTAGARDETGAAPGELPRIELPVDISVTAASIGPVVYNASNASTTIESIELAGKFAGSTLRLSRFVLRSTWLDLDLAGKLRFTGDYPLNARVEWRWTAEDSRVFAGTLDAAGDLQRLELQHVLLEPVAVRTSGSVALRPGDLSVDLLSQWQKLGWVVEERQVAAGAGSLQVRGSYGDLDVTLNASARVDTLPETRISLEANVGQSSIDVSRLGATNEFGSLDATGNVGWADNLTFDFRYALSDLDPGRLSPATAGSLQASGDLRGSIIDGKVDLDTRIAEIGGVLNGHPVVGRVNATFRENIVRITDGELRVGSNRATYAGSLGQKLELQADFELAALEEIVPDIGGKLDGRISISGTRERPGLVANISGSRLQRGGLSIDRLTLTANISQRGASRMDMQLMGVASGDRMLDSFAVGGAGTLAAHTLTTTITTGEDRISASASGGYDDSRWAGEFDSIEIYQAALGRWATREPSRLTVSGDHVSLTETCLAGSEGTGRFCASGDLDPNGSGSFAASITSLPVAGLPLRLPDNIRAAGIAAGWARGRYENGQVNAESEFRIGGGRLDAVIDDETISASFESVQVEASIDGNRAVAQANFELGNDAGGAALALTIDDISNEQSAVAGTGSIRFKDLALLGVFTPEISAPAGLLEGQLTVSGTLDRPVFNGGVDVTDASFGVRRLGINVSRFGARIEQLQPGKLRLDGSARSGDGDLSIAGEVSVSAEQGVRTEVLLTGENFELLRIPNWSLSASPTIAVIFDDGAARVSGELVIPAADITVKEIPETAVKSSPDAVVHRPESDDPAAIRRIDIDVRATLGDDVRLAAFGLTTAMTGSIRVQGGTHSPYTGLGRLTLQEGRYEAYGQELEIERGELIFNGALDNPQLDVRAVRRTTDVTAGIQLSGTPAQLSSVVFSEPALSDAEALSYLLTGRPLSSATSPGEGETLNNAAFALGITGAGKIVSQIQSELGLETLAIEGGADKGKIIAGKRFGQRLFVEYGYGVIDKMGTLLLRYQLNQRLTLESRTGSVSNLDVIYSVRKK